MSVLDQSPRGGDARKPTDAERQHLLKRLNLDLDWVQIKMSHLDPVKDLTALSKLRATLHVLKHQIRLVQEIRQ